jgi:hypothetical protein
MRESQHIQAVVDGSVWRVVQPIVLADQMYHRERS